MRNHKHIKACLVSPVLIAASAISLAGEIPAGAGSFTDEKPTHRWQPATAEGYDQTVPPGEPWGIHTPRQNQSPSVSNHFINIGKPTPTHEFWSSVIWEFAVENLIRDENGGIVETNTDMVPYSHWMANSPYTMKFTNRGVNLTYAQTPLLVPYRYEDPNSDKRVLPSTDSPRFTAYTYPARIDPALDPLGGTEFNIRFEGLDVEETLLDDYSDFSGTVLLNEPGTPETSDYAKVTMVNGSPYLHFEKDGLGDVTFTYFNGLRVIHESDGTLALYLGDVRTGYSIFAPPGTAFDYSLANDDLKELASRGEITMALPAGHKHFSVAILPNEINDIFKAPSDYTEQGFEIDAGVSVNELPTHIAGTHQPLVVSRLVGDFFREDEPGDGIGVEELDELIMDYRNHAFAVPTNTTFEYAYDENNAEVISDFTIDTQLAIDDADVENTTLMGLYRHQYLNTSNLDFAYTYATPRGEMKVIRANSFQTRISHVGLIPNLPNALNDAELAELLGLLDQDKEGQWDGGLTRNDVMDTYNNGKELNWMLQLLHIAEQTGENATAEILTAELKNHLEDWLSADDWQQDQLYDNSHCEPMAEPERSNCYRNMRLENEQKYFYYNEEWNSLTGFPASFGSDTELNDHHFHAGYIISAAAAIARYDEAWAQQWKPMVDLLIKDSANWERGDTRFQYLRYFDIYNGYSLANGHLNMDAGGNQESSSESINFAQATALWGAETGDQEIRDLGIFLYASEIQAVQQYWFDVDSKVFPKDVFWDDGGQFVQHDLDRSSVGLVWHSKADYGTWFSAAPRMVAGINFLPITGASLHLGHMDKQLDDGSTIPSIQLVMDRLDENTRFFAEDMYHMTQPEEYLQYDFRRKTHFWDDLMWEAEALVNPEAAASKFEAAGDYVREFHPSLPPLYPNAEVRGEAGESRTHTYHWIYNLRALGTPVKGISADTAHFAVFEKNGVRTHVAYNPGNQPRVIRFSDGVTIEVGPGELSGGSLVDLAPAVENLATNAISQTGANVTWSSLTGEWGGTDYHVVVTSNTGETVYDTTVTAPAITLANLEAGNTYSVEVVSVFEGEHGRSAETSFTTEADLSVIPPVANLSVTEVSQDGAAANWDAIPADYVNADYRVELLQGETRVDEITSTASATDYAFSNLSPATEYSVRVWASNDGMESIPTEVNFTTEAPVPECDPTVENYCINVSSSSARISLNWEASWADIRITSPSQSGGYRMPQTDDGQSYFDVTGLADGDEVNFEFTYFDTAGRELGPFTYVHSELDSGDGDIPMVEELSINSVSQTSAEVSWNALTGEYASASYEVQVILDRMVVHSEEVSNRLSITLSSLIPSTSYTVEVQAIFNSEIGSPAQQNFTTHSESGGSENCQDVDGREICHASNSGNLNVSLDANGWAIIHTATGNYAMQPDKAGNFVYEFTGLSNGDSVEAWFTIHTDAGAMDTGWATFEYGGTTSTLPTPTNLQISNIGETTVTATWQAPALEDGEGMPDYRATLMQGNSVEQVMSTEGATRVSFSGLSEGTDYTIEVVLLLGSDTSPATSVEFTTEGERQSQCDQQPSGVCAETQGDALRVSVYGALDWAIIHYAAGNFQMTAGPDGEFYYDIPGIAVGETVDAWFTINTATGAYDSDNYSLSHE